MTLAIELQPGTRIRSEGLPFKVHSTDFYADERWGVLSNRVLIETSTGKLLSFSIGQTVELA